MGARKVKMGTSLRVLGISAAVVLSLASAKRSDNASYTTQGTTAPPSARAMAPSAAVGLWKTTFGPVKIELDDKQGPGQVRGIWYYKRGNQEVVGDFGGQLRGNVLQFTWREPAKPSNLIGSGYLVFDQRGQRFHGKWWTQSKDRTGTWTGWRHGQRNRKPNHNRPPPPRQPYNDGYDRRPPPPSNPYGTGDTRRPPPPTSPPADNTGSGTTMPPM